MLMFDCSGTCRTFRSRHRATRPSWNRAIVTASAVAERVAIPGARRVLRLRNRMNFLNSTGGSDPELARYLVHPPAARRGYDRVAIVVGLGTTSLKTLDQSVFSRNWLQQERCLFVVEDRERCIDRFTYRAALMGPFVSGGMYCTEKPYCPCPMPLEVWDPWLAHWW